MSLRHASVIHSRVRESFTNTRADHAHGFTLVELMVTVAIVAILSTIAVPSFANMLRNAERRSTINEFWHAIFLARSEAIKRNSVVVICKSLDGQQCQHNASNWATGWLVFDNRDHDEPAVVDAGEEVLRRFDAHTGMQVRSNRPAFYFRPVTQGSINGTIVFCDRRGDQSARAIIISHTGRPRESSKDASNHALHCSS